MSAQDTAIKEGRYIYCIIAAEGPRAFGPLGIGERGDEIYVISFNGIAALVSNTLVRNYSVSRENMIAHEKAIEEVMKEYTVLPVRFATIADDEDEVKSILEREYDRFKDLLDKMKDKKELGLKAIFKEDLIYNDILAKHNDIRNLKEKLKLLPPAKTYYKRMEIGKMVEEALESEKEAHRGYILDALSPLAEDVKINNAYGENMILNAAFLVDKTREAEFDQRVQEFGAKYGDRIKFKYTGTLPPFNFVNLVIKPEAR